MMMKIVTASWYKLCLEIKLASVVKMVFLIGIVLLYCSLIMSFFSILLTEIIRIATEKKTSEETENNRNNGLKKAGNEFKTRQSAFWTEERIEKAASNAVATTRGGSDTTKTRYHENVNSLEMSPTQTHEGVFQSLMLRDALSMIHPNSIIHKRVPFRVIDRNSNQANCKQTIWRPWWYSPSKNKNPHYFSDGTQLCIRTKIPPVLSETST